MLLLVSIRLRRTVLLLNRELGSLDVGKGSRVGLESGLDPLGDKAVDLLGGTADEGLGVEERVELGDNGGKVRLGLDALDEVVLAALLLDNSTGLVREDTDLLVALLAVAAGLDHGHDNVLGGHEGELLRDAAGNDLGVDDHTLADILEGGEEDVGGEERLGEGDAAVGRVVERALEPLDRGGHEGVLLESKEVARERAETLRTHRVALVRHGRRADLVLLEGLLNLLEVGKETDVGGHLVHRGAERREGGEDIGVNLTRVGLATDGVGVREAKELSDALVESLDLGVVAVEEGKERGLGTGGALDTAEAEVVARTLEVAEVPEELLDPEGGTLADSGELGGLEVGEAESGEVAILLGEGGQARDDDRELGDENVETVTEEDEVGVVGDEARGGTKAGLLVLREEGKAGFVAFMRDSHTTTYWIIPAASGATVPKVCTWAMTSSSSSANMSN